VADFFSPLGSFGGLLQGLGAGAAGFGAGNLIGGQLPGSRAGGFFAGAGGGAAAGAAIGAFGGPLTSGLGAVIGGLVGGIGGLFGSSGADHAQKAQRLAADLQAQGTNTGNIGSFWTEALGAAGFQDLDGFSDFVKQQTANSAAGPTEFSFAGISGNLDQQSAIAITGSRLLLQAIQENNPDIRSLDEVEGFRDGYINFILNNTFIEQEGQVTGTQNIGQQGGLLAAAGIPTPGTQQHGSLPPSLSDFFSGEFDFSTGAPRLDPDRTIAFLRGKGINVPQSLIDELRGAQGGTTAQTIQGLLGTTN